MAVEHVLYQKILYRLLFSGLLIISLIAVVSSLVEAPWDFMIWSGVIGLWILRFCVAKVPNKEEFEKNFLRVCTFYSTVCTVGTLIGLIVRFSQYSFQWSDLPFPLMTFICILIGWIKIENREVSIEVYEVVGWETLVPTFILLLSGGFTFFNFGLLVIFYLFLKFWLLDRLLYGFKTPVLTRTAIYHASTASFWFMVVISSVVYLNE